MTRWVLLTVAAMAGAPAYAGSAATPPSDAVAVVDGTPITAAALDAKMGNSLASLRAQEYAIRRHALDETIADLLLGREAKARGITVARLLELEVDARVPEIDDARVERALFTARGPLTELPKAEAKKQIAAGIREVELQRQRETFVSSLAARAHVQVLLEPPRVPIDPNGNYAAGPADAPVTIVEFSDFQCPYCAQARVVLRDIALRYPKQVRIVYRHLPLPMPAHAGKAAEAAACAGEQGAFWEMGERMFMNQKFLDAASLKSYAAALKLDAAKFDQCLDSGRLAAAINTDKALAMTYGIRATPTIFVNGLWMTEPSLGAISKAVDDELTRLGVPAGEGGLSSR